MDVLCYAASVEMDLVLLKWWGDMAAENELEDVFTESARTPSGFFKAMQPPNTLFFDIDENGVSSAAWFEPFMGGIALGLWARKDRRGRKFLPWITEVFRKVFTFVPIVVFMTKQAHVVTLAQDYGFTIGSDIPYVYQGKTARTGYLTREAFIARYGE